MLISFSTTTAQSVVTRFSFTFYDTISCTGERIRFSGIMTLVERSGGDFHFTFGGAEGVGLTTGTVFHVAGVHHQAVNTDAAYAQTLVSRVLFVGQGQGAKMKVGYTVHVTRTPAGEVTVAFEQESITCR